MHIFTNLQGCTNTLDLIENNSNVMPYILATTEEASLVVEKQLICTIAAMEDVPLVLMSAFFCFNMCYPRGYNNFYTFMKIITLKFPVHRASISVKHFLSSLNSIEE